MSDDRRALGLALAAALLTSAAQVCIKTGRDALFFGHGGLDQLAAIMFFTQLGQVAGSFVHLRAIQRWGVRRVRVAIFVLATALFAGFATLTAVPIAMQVLFFAFPIVFAALLSSAWLLAGDLLEGADRDRVRKGFAMIGASATLGQIVGGLGARASSQVLDPSWLVGGGGSLLVAVAVVAVFAHRRYPPVAPRMSSDGMPAPAPNTSLPPAPLTTSGESSTSEDGKLEGQPYMKHPYTRALFTIASLGALIGLLIEFQFYASVTQSGAAGAKFFASFYVILAIGSLVLQLTVVPWMQGRLGVGGALLVLPIGIVGTAGAAAFVTTALMQSVVRATESGLRGSVHNVTWEQVFLPYERGLRSTLKLLVDGVTSRIVVGVAAVGLWVWGWIFGPDTSYAFLTWGILACALLWIGSTQLLRKMSCAPDLGDHDPMIRLPDA